MSDDLELIIEAFEELTEDEKLEFYVTYEELFKEFVQMEKRERNTEYARKRYNENEEHRNRQREAKKRYHRKKKLEKEKKLIQSINADSNISEKI